MAKEDIVKHQFKPGQTGNAKGRPPILPELKEAIAKLLTKEKDGKQAIDEVLNALYKKAIKGDVRAAQELFDRGYGKAKQTVDAKIEHPTIIEYRNVSKQYLNE